VSDRTSADGSVAGTTPPEVLFTGFPGFLGSALLRRVLDRGDSPVACLIQPQYRELAEERAEAIVAAVESDSGDGTSTTRPATGARTRAPRWPGPGSRSRGSSRTSTGSWRSLARTPRSATIR